MRKLKHKPSEHVERICEWLARGSTLRDYCRQSGSVNYGTVYDWLEMSEGKRQFAQSFDQDEIDALKSFSSDFYRAREIGQDVLAEEVLEIIDTEAEIIQSQHSSSRDSAHVTWLRNRAEYRLKLLAKFNPKKYGDRVDMTSSDRSMTPAASLAGFKLMPVQVSEKKEAGDD